MESPWGYGAVRAMYPSSLGGAFGSPTNPLPTYGTPNPAFTGNPGYLGDGVTAVTVKKSCGFGRTRRLIPNGVTTENGWGFNRYGKLFSKKKKRRRSRKKRRKSRRRASRRSRRRRRRSKKTRRRRRSVRRRSRR